MHYIIYGMVRMIGNIHDFYIFRLLHCDKSNTFWILELIYMGNFAIFKIYIQTVKIRFIYKQHFS